MNQRQKELMVAVEISMATLGSIDGVSYNDIYWTIRKLQFDSSPVSPDEARKSLRAFMTKLADMNERKCSPVDDRRKYGANVRGD